MSVIQEVAIGLYGYHRTRRRILSEFPPGTPPLMDAFNEEPDHQRTVRCSSGNGGKGEMVPLITANMALEQGKDVYALPGPLDSLSAGCNHLIQQGAGILLNPKNLLEEWGIETNVLCRNTEIKKREK